MSTFIGEIAALATSICWSFTSLFFTIAGREVGSLTVNITRLLLASILLIFSHYFSYGYLLPTNVAAYHWWWLGLSGIVGLVIGDSMLFEAFVIIGARLSMLIMSLVPIISTLFAWIFLHEMLGIFKICAILLTVSGIMWIILENQNESGSHEYKKYVLGIFMGLGGAMGQALGLVIAKKGLQGDFPALSANLIRIITATTIFWIITFLRGNIHSHINIWSNKKARWSIIGGSIFGPFVGIWLSLIAIKYAKIGIASTLMALPPIFLIPLSYWMLKEKSSWRSIFGTIVTIAGIAMIFLI